MRKSIPYNLASKFAWFRISSKNWNHHDMTNISKDTVKISEIKRRLIDDWSTGRGTIKIKSIMTNFLTWHFNYFLWQFLLYLCIRIFLLSIYFLLVYVTVFLRFKWHCHIHYFISCYFVIVKYFLFRLKIMDFHTFTSWFFIWIFLFLFFCG